jgi:hypothetical protein
MNLVAVALAAAVSGAAPVASADGAAKAPSLQLRPKAAIAVGSISHDFAPFLMAGEPELELTPRRDARLDASRSSCRGATSLCYDPYSGRIVFKPARLLMPEIPGFQRENISVKRDRIVLRYSW